MNIQIEDENLSNYEKQEVKKLLERQDPDIDNDLHQMWYLMDLVWDDYGCNNKSLDWEKIGKFYSDPVWLLNGLFIEQHDLSMQHRNAISDWIIDQDFQKVIDYGGGFGTLARLIAQKSKDISVEIYEPYPSEYSIRKIEEYDCISLENKMCQDADCIIATDVLEHVPDPIRSFSEMIDAVKAGGYLVVANHFAPSIKCHLPQNFHFRYTFDLFAKLLGLKKIGQIEGSHATIYRKVSKNRDAGSNTIRILEKLSALIFPVLEFARFVKNKIE